MQPMINTLLDPIVNFGKVTVSTGYDNVFTVIVLTAGHGSKLPDPNPSIDGPFNIVWYNASKYADPSDDPNVEIVRCTARVGDVLTVVRGQEGISASNKNTPASTYRMILSQTKKTITDIKAEYQSGISTHASTTVGVHGVVGNIVGTTDNQLLTYKTITDSTNNVTAKSLKSSTTTIDVSASQSPTNGQVLTATSGTTATWQYITVGIIPTGGILPYAGTTAPSGFLLCDGSAINRTTYTPLFTVISTTYGIGDGSTTFNVPDFRSRVIVGAGPVQGGLSARNRGGIGGEETHVLTVAELATHTHTTGGGGGSGSVSPWGAGNSQPGTVGSTGSNAGHNNIQPFGVANYIIKI